MARFDINDVKVTTSLTHKGKVAPKGSVFFIAKLKDKKNNMSYTTHQLIDRRGASDIEEGQFIFAMKQNLIQQLEAKQ